MADNRYGDDRRREGWRDRDRGSSIFSDDDDDRRRGAGREQGEPGRGDDERGFLDRAGDEVRAWFGDEEAERRRERDMMRDDARSAFGAFEGGQRREGRTPYRGDFREGGVRFGGEPAWGREEGAYGRSPQAGRGLAGGAQWDENYRRWRSQQIERFDRDYEEYRRERQQAFEKDFDSWRSSRLTQSGTPSATSGGRGAGQPMEGGSAAASTTATSATARPAEGSEPSTRSRGGRSTS
jgi:hypothetical protein